MGGKRKNPKLKRERDALAVRAGRCLRIARHALKKTQTEFAAIMGVGQNAYSQYETGEHLVDMTLANRLMDETGIDLHWIYRADPSRLPNDISSKFPPNWREIVAGTAE